MLAARAACVVGHSGQGTLMVTHTECVHPDSGNCLQFLVGLNLQTLGNRIVEQSLECTAADDLHVLAVKKVGSSRVNVFVQQV